jgi:hypothetical protein
MAYVIESECIRQLAPLRARISLPLWRLIAPIIILTCYLGAFIAVAGIELMPFFVFFRYRSQHPSNVVSVILVLLILLMIGIFFLIMVRTYRFLRVGVISFDALVFLVGSLFAVVYAIWLFFHPAIRM